MHRTVASKTEEEEIAVDVDSVDRIWHAFVATDHAAICIHDPVV